MSVCNQPTFFIPGWGFSSDIGRAFFKQEKWLTNSCNFLDLPYLEHVDIAILVKNLGNTIPECSNLVGWSLGGLIAIKLAAVFPEKVNRLILMSATPKFTAAPNWVGVSSHSARKFKRLAEDNFSELSHDFLKSVCFPSRNKIGQCVKKNFLKDKQDKNSWLNYLDILLNSDLREDYRAISSPILHVMGDQDVVTQVDRDKLVALNSKTQLMSVNGAGHAPFLSHPDVLLDSFTHFLHDHA